MIQRNLAAELRSRAAQMPAVAVTGPRQSGKTTLCRMTFPDLEYVSLEPLDVREYALSDPRGFLDRYSGGVIMDEVQRAPPLLSYLQGVIDESPVPGRFILTGSQHFGLSESITQSLAGRIGLLTLLPLSLDEVRRFDGATTDLWETLWKGGYPRIHDRQLDAGQWLADYVATYVQRDVRQVLNVGDLDGFTAYLRLLAGRTAQELHLTALGSDAGVTHNTARSWLSVLETSYIAFRLSRWHRRLTKRIVKAPKVHMIDSGLACHLLGIREPGQLRFHPLRGPLFENWVVSEILKARLNRGFPADLFHLREDRGIEIDLIVESGERIIAVEVKSGKTLAADFFSNLSDLSLRFARDFPHLRLERRLVYGGDRSEERHGVQVVPWDAVPSQEW